MTRKVLGILAGAILVFLFAVPAQAQQADHVALRVNQVVFIGLNVADVWTTERALGNGHREANPFMPGNLPGMLLVKGGMVSGVMLFSGQLAKQHPRLSWITMLTLNVGVGAVVAHNYRIGG